ncbi:MAG: hypothetical protein AAGD08_17080 [Pseudomonadota bacterium]
MLGAELTEHLGYEHGHEPPMVQANRRNGLIGCTDKSIASAHSQSATARVPSRFELRMKTRPSDKSTSFHVNASISPRRAPVVNARTTIGRR